MKDSLPLPPGGERKLVRVELTMGSILKVLATAVGAWLLARLLPVILVVAAALILVGSLNAAVTRLEARRWRRGWAIAVVFTTLLLLMGLVLGLTVPALLQQVAALLGGERDVRLHIADELARWPATVSLANSLRHWQLASLSETAARLAFDYSTRLLEVLGYLVSAIFLALYVMVDRDRLRGGLFAVVPRSAHVRLSRVLLNLELIVGGYVRGQVLTSLCIATFTFALLVAFGVKDALAISVFVGAVDVLPYVGVLLAIAPVVAAAAAQGTTIALIALASMVVYHEFENRFLMPHIYGQALRLPSSVILIALLAGGTLYGITGALLSLPVAAALLMLLQELRVQLPGEDIDYSAVLAQDERVEQEYERRVEGISAHDAAAIAVEISLDRQQHGEPVLPGPAGRSEGD
jgi:predicted PurR-regulated permease PerM